MKKPGRRGGTGMLPACCLPPPGVRGGHLPDEYVNDGEKRISTKPKIVAGDIHFRIVKKKVKCQKRP